MIPRLRQQFNTQLFTAERYAKVSEILAGAHGYMPTFRLAETPVFLPAIFKDRLLQACEEIIDVLGQDDFKQRTQATLDENQVNVPNEDEHTTFLVMDFAACLDENGLPTPQLIEVQGFPTLFFFQELLADSFRKAYGLSDTLTSRFDGLTQEGYVEKLRETIVGNSDPKRVVMLEIEPEKQNTYIDFVATEAALGIKVLCLTKLKKRDRHLYYLDEKGEEVPVEKIYNRIIFDELFQRKDLDSEFSFKDDIDAEWIGHPNWFYRISKYILPMIKSPFNPACYFLNELEQYPADLENYVLKPLFSFSGAGVKINITKADLDEVDDKRNYILQRKVVYAPVLETPNGPAKCEIRIMMVWDKNAARPTPINNLIRITKGEMVGVKYNKDKDWVGASIGFFE